MRPLSAKERLNGEQTCIRLIPGNRQLVLGRDRSFTFDNVLSSKTTQVITDSDQTWFMLFGINMF